MINPTINVQYYQYYIYPQIIPQHNNIINSLGVINEVDEREEEYSEEEEEKENDKEDNSNDVDEEKELKEEEKKEEDSNKIEIESYNPKKYEGN